MSKNPSNTKLTCNLAQAVETFLDGQTDCVRNIAAMIEALDAWKNAHQNKPETKYYFGGEKK